MNRVFIIGSANMDLVIQTPRRPAPGETLTGSGFLITPGGKGANQAVAAAKLGADARMLAKVGDDIFGARMLSDMREYGVDTSRIAVEPGVSTGVAVITLCEGENTILLDPGANARLLPADVEPHLSALRESDILVMQLEIPLETIFYALDAARGSGCRVIVNPAPAPLTPLPASFFAGLYSLTPNEHEAALMTGLPVETREQAFAALDAFREMGVERPIITMGGEGAVYFDGETHRHQRAYPPEKIVDTTAAGDTFTAAVAVKLSQGASLSEAMDFAARAAAITVSRLGAQRSIPTLAEMNARGV